MGHILVAFDEASFQLATSYKQIWFPVGETPRGAFFWSSQKLITFGALTSTHRFYYDFYVAQNSMTFLNFLRGFVATLSPRKKYVFILDNVAFHKTQIVRKFLAEYASRITVEHIPPYSPELNPIETCWKVTKGAVTKSQFFQTIDEMQDALETFWTTHVFTQDFIGYLCR